MGRETGSGEQAERMTVGTQEEFLEQYRAL